MLGPRANKAKNQMASLGKVRGEDAAAGGGVEVKVVTLDQFLEKHQVSGRQSFRRVATPVDLFCPFVSLSYRLLLTVRCRSLLGRNTLHVFCDWCHLFGVTCLLVVVIGEGGL